MTILHSREFKDSHGTDYTALTVNESRRHGPRRTPRYSVTIVRTGPRPVDIKRAERAARKASR